MALAGPRPNLSIARVLGTSLRIWGRSFIPFTAACAVVYLPVLAGSALIGERKRYCAEVIDVVGPLGIGILTCLLWLTTPAAVVAGVLRQLRGERASTAGCLRAYVTRLPPVVGVALMLWLAGIPAAATGVLGAGLLAFLGLGSDAVGVCGLALAVTITACLFWVAVPVAAVERSGATASLSRSLKLTRGSRGRILVMNLVTLGVQFGPPLALGALLDGRSDPTGGWGTVFLAILAGTYGAVVIAVGYHELRVAREGPQAQDLARVFA